MTGLGHVHDLRARLAAARLYLCTDARERQGDLAKFLDAVLGAGVDIVQLRQKGLEAGQELRFLAVFRAACEEHGALLAVNDRADVAYAAGADVLHLGQHDLPAAAARQILGPGPLIGLSSHDEAQASAASAAAEADYFCAGPVWPTPTKPGRRAACESPSVRSDAGPGRWPHRRIAGRPWFGDRRRSMRRNLRAKGAGRGRAAGGRRAGDATEAADPAAAAAGLAR